MPVVINDEHKKVFAREYLRNKPNKLMILRGIVETASKEQNIPYDPMTIVNLNDGILSDPIVIAEIEALENEPLKKGAVVRELHNNAQIMLARGDTTEYNKTMRLIAEIEGFIFKGVKEDSGKTGIGQLKELVESIGMDKP